MKRISLSLMAVALLLISSVSFAGVVDVRFTDGQLSDNQYCVTAQIKAQDINFEIGSATIFFSYNTDALKNPTSTSLNFNDKNTCFDSYAPYTNSFNFLENGVKGEGNYAILLRNPNEGCPTVSAEWLDVAEFCFEVKSADEDMRLDFITQYTAFNTVDNAGEQHRLGDAIGFEPNITSVLEGNLNTTGISITPNFTNNLVGVSFNAEKANDVQITIYDMLGRSVSVVKENVTPGTYTKTLDLSKYMNGYYLIEVDNGVNTVSEKVLLAK